MHYDEKEAAVNSAGDEQGTVGGYANKPAAQSLRDRVSALREHSQVAARRLEQLHELEYLIEKNPEVARILELIDFVSQ